MNRLHSTILCLFTAYLDQVIDLIHFVSSYRDIRTKLTITPIIDRIDRAKRRYDSADIPTNIEHTYADKQLAFQTRFEWFPNYVDSQIIGTVKSGNMLRFEQLYQGTM